MPRPSLKHMICLALAGAAMAGCGQSIDLDAADEGNDRLRAGAELFVENCGMCHTIDVVGTQGSAVEIRDRERVDGPNFNERPETRDAILYAIRNGGFSGAIMPENIVVGEEAALVADFLARYAGRNVEVPPTPSTADQGGGGETP